VKSGRARQKERLHPDFFGKKETDIKTGHPERKKARYTKAAFSSQSGCQGLRRFEKDSIKVV